MLNSSIARAAARSRPRSTWLTRQAQPGLSGLRSGRTFSPATRNSLLGFDEAESGSAASGSIARDVFCRLRGSRRAFVEFAEPGFGQSDERRREHLAQKSTWRRRPARRRCSAKHARDPPPRVVSRSRQRRRPPPRLGERHDQGRSDQAGHAGDIERRQVAGELGARRAGAEGGGRRAELVGGEDPAEGHVGALGPKASAASRTVGGTVATQSRP